MSTTKEMGFIKKLLDALRQMYQGDYELVDLDKLYEEAESFGLKFNEEGYLEEGEDEDNYYDIEIPEIIKYRGTQYFLTTDCPEVGGLVYIIKNISGHFCKIGDVYTVTDVEYKDSICTNGGWMGIYDNENDEYRTMVEVR